MGKEKKESTAFAVREDRRRKTIEKFRQRSQELAEGILQFYWDLGAFAADVLTESESDNAIEQRKYGPHMVEDIAPGVDLQPGVVRDSLRFYKQFRTQKQLEPLYKNEWSWLGVRTLVRIEDPRAQKQFRRAYEDGKYQSAEELSKAVKKFNKPGRKSASRKGRRSAGRGSQPMSVVAMKTCCTWFNTGVAQLIPEFLEGLEDFVRNVKKGMPAKTAEEGAESVQQIKEWVPMLRNLLDKIREAVMLVQNETAGLVSEKEPGGESHE